ncbi:ABC transporter permease [Blastococcus saxobsidens]|uniref:Peptide/nickel transport system permease protein n=1 Tax=Blastococcus saxobsidens TaxID=138336 RepID=A0A4Q7Y5R5_9ACTN|nr:ABC transporter permease [Blastococcus saxobsidens]RZU31774.1 peptide/nickel transport system permease protein [Blastococcus saxobsidens]
MNRRYLVRRLAQLPLTVAAILLAGFLLIHLAPGDPVVALAGQSGDAEYYAYLRAKFGLDKPLPTQLVIYAGNVLSGDLGTSYVLGRPVAEAIAERLPATVLLTGSALVLSTVVGISLGIYGARRHGRWPDTAVNLTALTVYAAPVFLIGQLVILGLALGAGWFPVEGMTDARSSVTGLPRLLDIAHHLALPALALTSQEVAAVARLSRVGLLDELRQDHIRTARAKGVAEGVVVRKHALRRALLPVVTVLGGRVGHLVAGAVIVEAVFGWPGLGRLLVTAMQNRDGPIVLGVFLLVAVTVVVANLLTDLLYSWLDPRVRYG